MWQTTVNMKILYVLFLLLPLSFVAANAQESIEKTAELLKTGNIGELTKDFAPTVEVTVNGNDESYRQKRQKPYCAVSLTRISQDR